MLFLSTPSARRATGCSTTTTPSQTYFYPRPPRGGRLETVKTTITGCYFYPRPPRGGRPLHPAMMVCSLISIHALREEGDATGRHHGTAATDFYPRPPRGGRRINPSQHEAVSVISIHALREEGDRIPRRESNQRADFYPRPPRGGRRAAPVPCYSHGRFLSTPSARRATQRGRGRKGRLAISIHALREEGDDGTIVGALAPGIFLSTPSARRATQTAI